jgi:GTPase SAR1 family protein
MTVQGPFSYKIALVGSTGTGKTQLLRLLEQGTPKGWKATRFDYNGRDSAVFEHLPLKTPRVLAVTASGPGKENGQTTASGNAQRFRGAEGAILVFSYEEPATFDELTDWLTVYQAEADSTRVLFLVGTHLPPTKDQGVFRRKVNAFIEQAKVDEYFEMARPDPVQSGRIFTRITERLAPAGAATREFLTTSGITKVKH